MAVFRGEGANTTLSGGYICQLSVYRYRGSPDGN
jgi:hypothetical protein